MGVKVKGVEKDLCGTTYVIPPLNLRALNLIQDKLSAYDQATGIEQLQISVDIIHAAMIRNYPEMTKEELLDIIDLENMVDVMDAVMGNSGFVKARVGEVLKR